MCVCVRMWITDVFTNPTLTLPPIPNNCSVHAAVQSGTPIRCKPVLTAEAFECMNTMLITADTYHFYIYIGIGRYSVTLSHRRLGRIVARQPTRKPPAQKYIFTSGRHLPHYGFNHFQRVKKTRRQYPCLSLHIIRLMCRYNLCSQG